MKKEKTGFEYADTLDCFGEFPTAFIDARYKEGRFYYLEDGKAVYLEENSLVRLTVYKKDIPENEREKFHTSVRMILPAGEILNFRLPGTSREFIVELHTDLIFKKEGNKPAKAQDVRCEVFEKGLFKEIEPMAAPSLNQAYFQVSVKYKPEARSHTVNIYDQFYVGKDPLRNYRF